MKFWKFWKYFSFKYKSIYIYFFFGGGEARRSVDFFLCPHLWKANFSLHLFPTKKQHHHFSQPSLALHLPPFFFFFLSYFLSVFISFVTRSLIQTFFPSFFSIVSWLALIPYLVRKRQISHLIYNGWICL